MSIEDRIRELKEKLGIDNLVGNLTEKALLLAGISLGLDKKKLEQEYNLSTLTAMVLVRINETADLVREHFPEMAKHKDLKHFFY